jgi:hypothetical protein
MTHSRSASLSSVTKEKAIEHIESAAVEPTYLEGFPLLVNKSEEELAALNKKVLSKLDWRFLPCITVMLLMKYESILSHLCHHHILTGFV